MPELANAVKAAIDSTDDNWVNGSIPRDILITYPIMSKNKPSTKEATSRRLNEANTKGWGVAAGTGLVTLVKGEI